MFRQAMGSLGLLLCLMVSVPVNGQHVGTGTQTENHQPQGSNRKANPEEIEKLITQLGNKNFPPREAASKTLEDMGLEALPALRKAASAATDAEVRRRAGNLVRAIESLHEAEIEFAWFDGLGFPDIAKCKFVRVATGHYYHERDGTPKIFYELGFLVRDDRSKFTVLDAYLWSHTYTKSGPQTAEHEKVSHEPWDLEKETIEILKALQKPKDKDGLPRRLFERLAEPAELFVWARACAAQGKPKLADQLFFQAKRTAEGRDEPFHQVIADAIAHAQMWQAVKAFGDPGTTSRKDLLARFEWIVKNFPQSPHAKQAKETVDLLKKMVAEDEAHAREPVKPVEKMTRQERIAELIFRLRDQNGHQFSQPGHCDIFLHDFQENKKEKSPALQLVETGYAAVPQLIEVLTDERFSRSVGFHRDFRFSHFVLRVGDCAEAVLERIAGRTFWEPKSTAAAMLKDGQGSIVKAKAQEWWQEFQEKGEKQILIEGVRSGDYDSAVQAERLVKKYPESALSAIQQGVRNAKRDSIAKSLIEASAGAQGDSVTEFLREQLHASNLLSRVAAARGLLGRAPDKAVNAMIAEWNKENLGDGREDLINFLLWCGHVKAVNALATNLQKRPVKLGADVIRAVDFPGRDWEKSRKTIAPAVEQAIDDLLVGELDDLRKCEGIGGVRAGKEYSSPRLCDLSGEVLAQRWKRPDAFDLTASQEIRDRQRMELKNEWLNKRRKE